MSVNIRILLWLFGGFLGGAAYMLYPTSSLSVVCIPVLMVFFFSFFFSRDFLGLQPYFWLIIPYLVLNFVFIYVSGVDASRLPLLMFLGMSSLSVSYWLVRFGGRNRCFVARVDNKFFLSLFFISFLSLFLLKVWMSSGVVHSLALVSNLVFKPTLEFALAGSFFVAIGFFSFSRAILCLITILGYLLVVAYISDDVSRMSFFQYFFLASVAIYYRMKNFRYFRLGWITVASLFLLSLVLVVNIILEGVVSGGDSLLYINALDVMSEVDRQNKFHPFMPLHNSLGILVPDALWLVEKPKGYSTSGWYIENVMNVAPSDYPWGVGVTSFAAGYLYGGHWGVVCLFVIYGVISGVFRNAATNPFMLGVLVVFNLKLIFCIFRMDETMLLGASIPSVFIMYICYRLISDRMLRFYSEYSKGRCL